MAKLKQTSQDVLDFINNEWENTDLGQIGVILKVISTNKSKQMLKLSKASKTTEFLIREQDVLTLVVYEAAWDNLTDLQKILLLRGVFSTVSYDTEKERLNIDTRPYQDLFNMRHAKDANGNEYLEKYDEALECAALVIENIEETERRMKEEEKEAKRAAKEAKKAAKASRSY